MADSKFDKFGRIARNMYVKQNTNIDDIAEMLDISRKTIGEWSAAGKWVQERKRNQMRPAELAEFAEDILYAKMQHLRDMPPEQIDSGILDGLAKLMGQADEMKRHASLLDKAADVMEHYIVYCKTTLTGDALKAEMTLMNGFLSNLEANA